MKDKKISGRCAAQKVLNLKKILSSKMAATDKQPKKQLFVLLEADCQNALHLAHFWSFVLQILSVQERFNIFMDILKGKESYPIGDGKVDGAQNLFAGVVRARPDKDSLLGPLWNGEGATHDPIYADAVEARPDEEPNKMNPAQFKRVASQ